jgi:melanocyte protein PMEL
MSGLVSSKGRFWQVADGPSSSLSIDTDNVPLGSYKMEVVIYHSRGDDQFIPLGYASTQFSITGLNTHYNTCST